MLISAYVPRKNSSPDLECLPSAVVLVVAGAVEIMVVDGVRAGKIKRLFVSFLKFHGKFRRRVFKSLHAVS